MTPVQSNPLEYSSPPPPAGSSNLWKLMRRSVRDPAFVVIGLILLVCAIGLYATVESMQLHFRKIAVPLRVHPALKEAHPQTWERKLAEDYHTPLQTLPTILGTWVQTSRDDPLDPDTADALAAGPHYIFRDYVDASALGRAPQQLAAEVEQVRLEDRRSWTESLLRNHPAASVKVAVTYYTGKADTVAHVPERCYLGEGYNQVGAPKVLHYAVGSSPIEVRLVTFEAPSSPVRANVVYYFHVNGRQTSDSILVRKELQSLFAKYAYYAKVELRTSLRDADKASAATAAFLAAAAPEIEKMLPDWTTYRDR